MFIGRRSVFALPPNETVHVTARLPSKNNTPPHSWPPRIPTRPCLCTLAQYSRGSTRSNHFQTAPNRKQRRFANRCHSTDNFSTMTFVISFDIYAYSSRVGHQTFVNPFRSESPMRGSNSIAAAGSANRNRGSMLCGNLGYALGSILLEVGSMLTCRISKFGTETVKFRNLLKTILYYKN